MDPFAGDIEAYKSQMRLGSVPRAYRGLMEYLMALRTHFNSKYPDFGVSGSLYSGYMDMSYFALFPKSLKERNLKIAIVFLHEAFRFEVWLSGVNKQSQAAYWKLFKESGWDRYRLVPGIKGFDSIIESILVEDPDFHDLDALTEQIEQGTLKFIEDVEAFLTGHPLT